MSDAFDSFDAGQFPLTGVSEQVTGIPSNCVSVVLKNTSTVNKMFIGNGKVTAVTAANGFPLDPGQSITVDLLSPSKKLWVLGTAADRLAWCKVSA